MSSKQPWRLAEVTLKEVRRYKYQVAVLPVGATEPHNLHLPYGTDNCQAAEISERACAWAWKRGARAALLSTVPFGADQNLLAFPMVISLDQNVLDEIVAGVARSLAYSGVNKLVVINGHGGNDFKPGLRALYGRTPVFCCAVNWWEVGLAEGGKNLFESAGDHGGEMETSVMLELAPHLVRKEWADNGAVRPSRFEAGRKGWVWYPRPWERLTKNTGSGDPRPANAGQGRRFLKLAEERIGRFLVELARAPRDKYFPFEKPKKA